MLKINDGNMCFFDDAEVGDTFYKAEYLRFGNGPRSVAQYTITKAGKRDIVCTLDTILAGYSASPELRISRTKGAEFNVYSNVEDIQPLIHEIHLHRKRESVRAYMEKAYNTLPESLLDAILEFANKESEPEHATESGRHRPRM